MALHGHAEQFRTSSPRSNTRSNASKHSRIIILNSRNGGAQICSQDLPQPSTHQHKAPKGRRPVATGFAMPKASRNPWEQHKKQNRPEGAEDSRTTKQVPEKRSWVSWQRPCMALTNITKPNHKPQRQPDKSVCKSRYKERVPLAAYPPVRSTHQRRAPEQKQHAISNQAHHQPTDKQPLPNT